MNGRGQWLTTYNKVRRVLSEVDVIKGQVEEFVNRQGELKKSGLFLFLLTAWLTKLERLFDFLRQAITTVSYRTKQTFTVVDPLELFLQTTQAHFQSAV
jgi:hypothetical protein